MSLEATKQLAAAMLRLKSLELSRCFDPFRPKSKPNDTQEEILRDIVNFNHRIAKGGNQSGKTSVGGREYSWLFEENHPYWERPNNHTCNRCKTNNPKLLDEETETYECQSCKHVWVDWKDEPLTLLIGGRTSEIYTEIWEKKIRPFLSPGSYKPENSGGVLQRVINPKNGNKIIFFSHHSPEEAREKVQMYAAHGVWLDEMPRSYKLFEELQRRCQSKSAPFLATFTPKVIEKTIRKMVDTPSPYKKVYHLHTFDNPINKVQQKKDEILASMAGLPKDLVNTLLTGEWYGGENAVYEFGELNIKSPGEHYSPAWRHLEVVDPAASGLMGFALMVEDPATHHWFVVRAEYIKGAAASDLLDELEKKTQGYNIVKRVSDPHEAWFIKEASKRGRQYVGVVKKNERKMELIKNLQEGLTQAQLFVAPWCEDACDEFYNCQWSATAVDKIVGGKNYHILDALQYGWDCRPKPEVIQQPIGYYEAIKAANKKQKERREKSRLVSMNKFARLVGKNGRTVRRG